MTRAPGGTLYLCAGCLMTSADPAELVPCKSPRLVLVDEHDLTRNPAGQVEDCRLAPHGKTTR